MFVSVTEKLQLRKRGLCFRVWRRPSWRRIWRGRSRFSFPAVVKRCVDRMYTHTPSIAVCSFRAKPVEKSPTRDECFSLYHRRVVPLSAPQECALEVTFPAGYQCLLWMLKIFKSSFTDLMLCVCALSQEACLWVCRSRFSGAPCWQKPTYSTTSASTKKEASGCRFSSFL